MAEKSRKTNTLLNTAAGFGEKFITFLLGFVMRSLFIRVLGVEYTGVSGLFTDILSALSLAELGVSSAITYAMYKPVAVKDNEKIAQLMNFYKRAYQVVAAVIFGAGCLILPVLDLIVKNIPPEIEDHLSLIYLLYVVNSAVSYLLVYKSTLLTAHQERRYISVVNIFGSIVRVAIEAFILIALKDVLDPTPRFITYLIAGIVITRAQNYVVSVVAAKRYPEIDRYKDAKLPKEEQKRIFKDVRSLMIYKICNAIMRSVDSVIISAMFGTAYVGLMGNYTLVTTRTAALVNQFYNSATPSIGNLVATSDKDKQFRTFKVMQFMAFWIGCLCTVAFFVLMNPFINLWLGSPKYVLSVPIAAVVAMNFYIGTISHPLTAFRNSNGLFVQGRYRPIFMALINVGLSVLLAVLWGENGQNAERGIFAVKLATILAQFFTMQWYDPYLLYSRVFGKRVSTYFCTFLTQLAIVAGSGALSFWLASLVDTIPGIGILVSFLIKAVICLTVANAAIFIVFRKTAEFRDFIQMLKGMIRGRKNK